MCQSPNSCSVPKSFGWMLNPVRNFGKKASDVNLESLIWTLSCYIHIRECCKSQKIRCCCDSETDTVLTYTEFALSKLSPLINVLIIGLDSY